MLNNGQRALDYKAWTVDSEGLMLMGERYQEVRRSRCQRVRNGVVCGLRRERFLDSWPEPPRPPPGENTSLYVYILTPFQGLKYTPLSTLYQTSENYKQKYD